MEKDNDKVIKITKGKIKLAGLLLGLTLTAAGGYAISKSRSSEKEQISVETEAELEEEIKTEENSFFSKEPVVEELNDDHIYEGEELESLYFAFSLSEEKEVLVKEVSISDICTKDTKNNRDITYGEYYLGDDCYNLFGDDSTKEDNNIKLYISIPDDVLVSAINYDSPDKNGKYLSELELIGDNENPIIYEIIQSLKQRLKECSIMGFQITSLENVLAYQKAYIEMEQLQKVGKDEIEKLDNYFISEEYSTSVSSEYDLSEPDGYIKYTKKR